MGYWEKKTFISIDDIDFDFRKSEVKNGTVKKWWKSGGLNFKLVSSRLVNGIKLQINFLNTLGM